MFLTALQAVLVAGEVSSAMKPDRAKTRPGKYLGGHCSLHNIAEAYNQIREFLPAERIIVIGQVAETIAWLREAANSEEECGRLTGRSSLRGLMQRKLESTLGMCATLLGSGGADYDFEDVNPATLLR